MVFPPTTQVLYYRPSDVEIIAEWALDVEKGSEYTSNGWRKLSIKADSTFVMLADSTEKEVIDTIPGWHAGFNTKGKWQMDNNNLLFYVDDLGIRFPLRYEIVELTGTRLVLLSRIPGGDTATYTRYSGKN
jgi:hypothetical protein